MVKCVPPYPSNLHSSKLFEIILPIHVVLNFVQEKTLDSFCSCSSVQEECSTGPVPQALSTDSWFRAMGQCVPLILFCASVKLITQPLPGNPPSSLRCKCPYQQRW